MTCSNHDTHVADLLARFGDDVSDIKCECCGEQLTLGPANDTPSVEIEIRAARMGGDGADIAFGDMTRADRIGRICALTGEPGGFSPEPDQIAGWLSMVIETHELEHMDDDVEPYEDNLP